MHPDDVVDRDATRGMAATPELLERGATGRHRDVAPAQLAEKLGVQSDQERVHESRICFNRDDGVVRQLADAGKQPLLERVAQVAPDRAVETDADLRRSERLRRVK